MTDALPFPSSVCHGCRWLVPTASARAVYLRCTRPDWPKYPPQPLVRCAGREPKSPTSDSGMNPREV